MNSDSFAKFRQAVSRRARQVPMQWEASRKLIEGPTLSSTIARLYDTVQSQDLPSPVKNTLLNCFERDTSRRVQDLDGEELKSLTGLPPAKAIRALSVFFGLVLAPASKWPLTSMSAEEIERAVRRSENPFDILYRADVASVLDIGAGDLSFAEELVDLYGSQLVQQKRRLILHCFDRLDPRSKLGGPLHAEPERLQKLRRTEELSFAFFGNQDMFELRDLEEQGLLAPRYTIVTCWAPATPTFAYEPTRLSDALIAQELQRSKGTFRHTRFEKELALEVQHGNRALLFPPWKFDVVGPRALLHLLAGRGAVCVLGSVDVQVFWELLAQLLDDPRYRPQDEPFNAVTLPNIFGKLYDVLSHLPIGESVDLEDLATLRREYQDSSSSVAADGLACVFRYARISRGATFPAVPASSTARKFASMTEEVPPWMITLVPV